MSKSLVERYEQVLAEDPSSGLFVELARVLVETGDDARAIDVCQQGLLHNRESVAGRVMWGKALINLGRPAEAMEQFDRAVGVDRENPLAYHLIGEVLLSKGLYRSALPLLRKAVVLSPGDETVRDWLEQTQTALSGGAQPVLQIPQRPLDEPLPDVLPKRVNGEAGPGRPPEERKRPSRSTPVLFPPAVDGAAAVGPRPADGQSGVQFLSDIPEIAPEPTVSTVAPARPMTTQATEALAQEYERELRAKVDAESRRETFLHRHGRKLFLGTVIGAALGVGLWEYVHTRSVNHGKDLRDALSSARKAFALDTAPGYRGGLQTLSQAVSMDERSEEAWALTAYGRALLWAEHGNSADDRARAEAAVGRRGVAEKFPGLSLLTRAVIATGAERDTLRDAVLASSVEQSEVHEMAGRIGLLRGDPKRAVLHFKRALQLNGANVRALVALGDYYRQAQDDTDALPFYATAAPLSPEHPDRVLGEAESKMALGQDLSSALAAVEKLSGEDVLTPIQRTRRALDRGRLLSMAGAHPEAIRALTEGLAADPAAAYDFQLWLGDAQRGSGDLASAQKSLEAAARARPRSEDAREALARVLLARDREREVLSRFGGDESKRLALLRGVAWTRLKDPKRARAELSKTQVGGRVPVEAVVYLSWLDAVEGDPDKAQAVLEKLQASGKRPRSDVSVMLGKLAWQRGVLDRARGEFEEAIKDPRDYEGACSLGRLLLSKGAPDRAAALLEASVQRNGSHGEARHALGRAYLSLGKVPEGLQQAEAWQKDNPQSAPASRDIAFAQLQAGRWRDAEVAVERALKTEPADPESHRIRAATLFARGDGRSGFAEIERAAKLAPQDPDTLCARGRAYLRQANAPLALKDYQAALKEDPDSACAKAGPSLVKPGTAKGAARTLQQLGAQTPRVWDRALASAALARVALAAGSLREARRVAEEAVERGPFLADAHHALGLVLRRQKEDARACEALAHAVQLDPSDGGFRLSYADALAAAQDGDPAKAVAEYQAFLRLAPRSPEQARVKKLLPGLKKRISR